MRRGAIAMRRRNASRYMSVPVTTAQRRERADALKAFVARGLGATNKDPATAFVLGITPLAAPYEII